MNGPDASSLIEQLRESSSVLAPQPTSAEARLPSLSGIRAVLFDVYGTLFISGSGEVGTAAAVSRKDAAGAALVRQGWPADSGAHAAGGLDEAIRRRHADSRLRGIDYPEIDIREVWLEVLDQPPFTPKPPEFDVERLALEYESLVNPVWPMPGARAMLERLSSAGLILGLVSNAQFFTPMLFPALMGSPASDLGIPEDLQYYSYRYGRAKPDEFLYRQAADRLGDRGIAPGQVLYAGNDMLNDVLPAGRVGFRTALFAGDARSLRCRQDDPRVEGVEPDLVIVDWNQLVSCLGIVGQEP